MTTKVEKTQVEETVETKPSPTNGQSHEEPIGDVLFRLPGELWGVLGDLQYTLFDVPPQALWDETLRWREFVVRLQETFAAEIEEARAQRIEEARASRGYNVGNGWPEKAGRALTDRQVQFGLSLARKAGLSEDEAQRRLDEMDAEGFDAFIAEMKAAQQTAKPSAQKNHSKQGQETPTTCAKCNRLLTPPQNSNMPQLEYARWVYKKHGGLCWKCRKGDAQ